MRESSAATQKDRAHESGFSLFELLVVVVVMLVVAAVALPTISNTLQVIKLRGSADNVAELLQRARIQAVKDNRFYTVIFASAPNGGLEACIDLNWDQKCGSGEPMVQLAGNVSLITGSQGPSDAVIACGPFGYSTCPAGFTGLNYWPQLATVYPSYNARGLPCVGNPASPPPDWSKGVQCSQMDNSSSPKPVGFLYEFQYAGSDGNTYAAVSVTPSGLVGVWLNSGSSWTHE